MTNRRGGFTSAFFFQILSVALPALLILLTVPYIRSQLSLEKFAAYTILLTTVGLITALDGGLGRASTYFVRSTLKSGKQSRVYSVVHGLLIVGMFFAFFVGMIGLIGVFSFEGAAITNSRPALVILLGFVPVFVVSSILRGFIEAEQRFVWLSTLQLLYGITVAISPALLFSFSSDLRIFTWAVVLARVAFLVVLLFRCGIVTRSSWNINKSAIIHALRVFKFAKWLFLSNIVGLVIVFADRFFVANLFSNAIVATYLLSMEMVSRLQIFITAFCTVVFPRLITNKTTAEASRIRLLLDAQALILCVVMASSLLLTQIGGPMVELWLGTVAVRDGTKVLVIGILGVGLIGCAALAMLELNSRGIAKPIALLHVSEMPMYLVVLYFAANTSSVDFILIAWILRLIVDAIAMNLIAIRSVNANIVFNKSVETYRRVIFISGLVLTVFTSFVLVMDIFPIVIQLFVVSVGMIALVFCVKHFFTRVRFSIQLPN